MPHEKAQGLYQSVLLLCIWGRCDDPPAIGAVPLTYSEALQEKQLNARYQHCCHDQALWSWISAAPRLQLPSHLRGDHVGLVKLQSEELTSVNNIQPMCSV